MRRVGLEGYLAPRGEGGGRAADSAVLPMAESCRRLGMPVRKYLGEVLPGVGDRQLSEVAVLTPSACARRRMA